MNQNQSENVKIGFIGCGNMTSAIVRGMLQTKSVKSFSANDVIVSNRGLGKLEVLNSDLGVGITQDNQELCEASDVIILGIKPQMFETVCKPLSGLDLSNKLLVSIAAGVKTTQISQLMNQDLSIIRAMPNTPSMILEGATGLFANKKCHIDDKAIAEKIFKSVGKIAWVDEENKINTVTAIAGSAPAYVYLFMQAMIDQACELGFDEKDARTLVTQSFLGTSKLAQIKSGTKLDDLRQAVTSPGGTTFEAIESFNKNNFSAIVKKAVNAAYNRGVTLGEQE